MKVFVCILYFFSVLNGEEAVNKMDFDASPESVNRGKEALKSYQSKNNLCWLNVVSELKSKCSEMTDLERRILAIKFSNCHFEESGLKTYECTNEVEFKACTKSMNEESQTAFLVYTEFFTHVTDICFYLQSELWREKTAKTISDLSWTTEKTVAKLDKSLQNQNLVLEAQDKALLNQQQMLENEENLKTALENSTTTAKAAFQEMKQKADEQQAIFSHTFDGIFSGINKLSELQAMLLGEFIGLQSLAFYIVAVVSCYLFTSSPRTLDARLILFVSFALLVIVEKMIVRWAVENKDHYESSSEWLHTNVWFVRKVFIAVSLFILGYFATRYRDYTALNNLILQELQEKVQKMYEIEIERNGKTLPVSWGQTDGVPSLVTNNPKPIDAEETKFQTHKISSTPAKQEVNEASFLTQQLAHSTPATKRILLSDDGYDTEEELKKKAKKFSKKNFIKQSQTSKKKRTSEIRKHTPKIEDSQPLNQSVTPRYNLRSRSNTPLTSASSTPLYPTSGSHKRTEKKDISNIVVSPGFFSSDED